jgi:GntR family transcriptional repressor for pyruvate dehydrogenase complex
MNNADSLYQYFEGAIIEGSLRVGARLPAERELAQRYQLARSSVREVLQRLKAKGWIVSKRGGGHYVSAQLQQDMAEPILRIIENNPNAHFDLLEFRHSIEGDCAYNAALRANEVDLLTLRKAYSALQSAHKQQNIVAEANADAKFHLAIAEASHNLIFLHLMKSLFAVFQVTMRSSITQMFESSIAREALLHQHSAIYDAIVHRQPSTAKEAAHKHIRYVEQLLQDLLREQQRRERSQRRYSYKDDIN